MAFTLVELLVVISIIALLLSILMPSLGRARNSGRSVVCGSYLRQLELAAKMYSQENRDVILPANSSDVIYWHDLLDPYIAKTSTIKNMTLRCPGFISKYNGQQALQWRGSWGYGTNVYFNSASGIAGRQSLEKYKNPGKLSQIKQFAKTVQFYDNDNWLGGSSIGGYCEGYPRGATTSYYYLWKAHGDMFNVAFFDGHVERVKFKVSGRSEGHAAGEYPQFIWKPY
jgi:prepilin-type processing-associated H-X9-DG protein/prepilin-type N-terminal cleavage/methylation domain-containing protein